MRMRPSPVRLHACVRSRLLYVLRGRGRRVLRAVCVASRVSGGVVRVARALSCCPRADCAFIFCLPPSFFIEIKSHDSTSFCMPHTVFER